MLDEADLKTLVAQVIAGLPSKAALQMTTFVPRLGEADAAARPVFALFVADSEEDLSKSMEILGYGLAKAIGIDGPVLPANAPASMRSIN